MRQVMLALAKVESRQWNHDCGEEFRQADGGDSGLLLLVVRSHGWLSVVGCV